MLEVTKIWCRSFDLDRIDLFWEIGTVAAPRRDEDPHEILSYEFFILRAGDSPLGPFEQIGGPFVDRYSFRDSQVNLLHKWRQYHYKLRVIDRRTGEAQDFGPTSSSEAAPDLIAMEIRRQEDVLFREYVGRRAWLYPIRTFGPRCNCYDTAQRRLLRSNHRPCFGTGFLGGYMSPVEIFIQIDPSVNQTTQTSLQERQDSDTIARLIGYPPVNPKDVIIESENRRWRVISVRQTERLRAVVRQELQIHEIPRGDIEYDLPVHIDERAMKPSADRNFTNPQNIDRPDAYEDILSAYSVTPYYGQGGAPQPTVLAEVRTIAVINETNPAWTLDGVNGTFQLAYVPNPVTSVIPYVNGVRQFPGVHFSVADRFITFVPAAIPAEGSTLYVDYWH